MCVCVCVVMIDSSCVCSCLHSANQLSLCDSAVFIWCILNASLCASIFMPAFTTMIFVTVVVHAASSATFGCSVVLQMTCTNHLPSSFNPKITRLPFFSPQTACVTSICLNSFLKKKDSSLAHSAGLSCSRAGQLD